MKHFLATFLIAATVANVSAEIVITPVRPTDAAKDKPGIIVPGPKDSATAPAEKRPETIVLTNGDTLQGLFLAFDAKGGARWQHPAVKLPIELDGASISRVKLERAKVGDAAQKQNCSVKLLNGDELVGELMTMDEEKLTLDTWYGGTLTIPRKSVRQLSPGLAKMSTIYEGPTGMDGWTGRNPNVPDGAGGIRIGRIVGGIKAGAATAWQYQNEAFVTSSSGAQIGRTLKLATQSNIEFDVAWRGYFQLAIYFYTDRLEQHTGNAYILGLNPQNIYLQRMTAVEGQNNLGNTNLQSLQQKTSAHISIRVNKEQKTISLLVDNILVQQWKDNQDFAGKGNGLMFVSQGQGAVKLSGIRVTEWDGKIPANLPAASGKLSEDLARLVNNDSVSGVLKGIKDGKIAFTTSFASLDIPLERVGQIELAQAKIEKPVLVPGEVRATFAGRGSVTFTLENWDANQVTGYSPNLGRVKFSPAAFSQVEFNLDKQKAASDDLFGF